MAKVHKQRDEAADTPLTLDGTMHAKKRRAHEEYANEKIVCYTFICVNALLVILIITLNIIIDAENHRPEPVTKFCFSKSLIDGHPYDRHNVSYCDGTQCCLTSLNSTGGIIQNLTSHWLKLHIAKSNDTFERFDCRKNVGKEHNNVKLTSREKRSADGNGNHCVAWNCSSNKNIREEKCKYFSNNEDCSDIFIQQNGLYHVYSHINIQYNDSDLKDPYVEDFYHIVISSYEGENENVLMRDAYSQCSCSKDTPVFTSHLGSDFYLRAGDKLRVRVLEKPHSYMTPEGNFFGVVKL